MDQQKWQSLKSKRRMSHNAKRKRRRDGLRQYEREHGIHQAMLDQAKRAAKKAPEKFTAVEYPARRPEGRIRKIFRLITGI